MQISPSQIFNFTVEAALNCASGFEACGKCVNTCKEAGGIIVSGQCIRGAATCINNKANFTLADIISTVISFLFPIAGLLLFVIFIWGGYDYLLSRGNPKQMQAGQAKITNGVIGMVLLIFSYIIVRFIVAFFGAESQLPF
jgi:hypothetical protein